MSAAAAGDTSSAADRTDRRRTATAAELKGSRPVQVVSAYGASQGGNYVSGLAFNAFLAMFPLILGMLAMVGLVIHDPATEKSLHNGIVSVFPSDAHSDILNALTGVKRNAGILGLVSFFSISSRTSGRACSNARSLHLATWRVRRRPFEST